MVICSKDKEREYDFDKGGDCELKVVEHQLLSVRASAGPETESVWASVTEAIRLRIEY